MLSRFTFMCKLVVSFMLVSSLGLLAQIPTVSDLDKDSFSVGSVGSEVGKDSFNSFSLTASSDKERLLIKVAEVFSQVIKRCSRKPNSRSKNTYVFINKLTERGFYNLDLLIKKRINQKNDYFDFSEDVNIRRNSLEGIIQEIKRQNYFNNRLAVELVGLTDASEAPIPTRYNSANYIYLLKDFKVPLKRGNFIYNIRLSVIDPRTSKVLCNVLKRIDVTDEYKIKPKAPVKANYTERTNYLERSRHDNFFSMGAYFSGNPLSYGYLKIFDAVYNNKYQDSLVLSMGGALEYDRRVIESFYLGLNVSLGYLYYGFPSDTIFQLGMKQLLVTAGAKSSYMINFSEYYEIDFFLGGKVEYFHLLGTHNFLIGAFTGFRFSHFKIEFAFPFPFVKIGLTFPF